MTARRPLSFYAYAVGFSEDWQPPTRHSQVLAQLRAWGFPVSDLIETVRGADGCLKYFADMQVLRAALAFDIDGVVYKRSEEHTSELQSLMRISYAVFCLKKKQT